MPTRSSSNTELLTGGPAAPTLELKRLPGVLKPLETSQMPLDQPPPRETRFGSPLELSRVHWVRPKVVVEVAYLTWTEAGLLRAVSYQGQRTDKPAREVVLPHIAGETHPESVADRR